MFTLAFVINDFSYPWKMLFKWSYYKYILAAVKLKSENLIFFEQIETDTPFQID